MIEKEEKEKPTDDINEKDLQTSFPKDVNAAETFEKKTQELSLQFPFIKKNNLDFEDILGLGYVLKNLWGEKGIAMPLDKKNNSWIEKLSNIILPSFLVALYHEDTEEYEFIYQPIHKDDKYIRYSFNFTYDSKVFTARFDEPSDEFKVLATHTYCSDEENEKRHRNIPLYFQYYGKNTSRLPEAIRFSLNLKFHDKVAVNFFVKGNFKDISQEDQIMLFQHLNLMLYYYDRKSPQIIIIQDNNNVASYPIPNYSDSNDLPSKLNIKKLQINLLDLLTTARNAPSVRLQYLYYFQVIEFCTYYFLTADIKRQIQDVLEAPGLLAHIDKHTQKLIDIIQDDYYNKHSEEDRLKCMFREYCSYEDIKLELENNKEYFQKKHTFKGGYTIERLFSDYDKIKDTSIPSVMDNIYNNIIKLRNVLVHARESHQNTSISPCLENENQLKPYLYVVQRMAEIISRKFS